MSVLQQASQMVSTMAGVEDWAEARLAASRGSIILARDAYQDYRIHANRLRLEPHSLAMFGRTLTQAGVLRGMENGLRCYVHLELLPEVAPPIPAPRMLDSQGRTWHPPATPATAAAPAPPTAPQQPQDDYL